MSFKDLIQIFSYSAKYQFYRDVGVRKKFYQLSERLM